MSACATKPLTPREKECRSAASLPPTVPARLAAMVCATSDTPCASEGGSEVGGDGDGCVRVELQAVMGGPLEELKGRKREEEEGR